MNIVKLQEFYNTSDVSLYYRIQRCLYHLRRYEIECDCFECREMCMRAPCIGTPEEIYRLLLRGEHNNLELLWQKYIRGFVIAPRFINNQCVYYDEKIGCKIHSYKLSEGRIGIHEYHKTDYNMVEFIIHQFMFPRVPGSATLSDIIAYTWKTPAAHKVWCEYWNNKKKPSVYKYNLNNYILEYK